METINGEWIMKGCVSSDPSALHVAEELISLVRTIGFLPLFSNDIPGFSVEERVPAYVWWTGDEATDPWEWRMILARDPDIAYGKFFNKAAGFISKSFFPTFANYRRNGYDFDALFEDELASYRAKKVMDVFDPDDEAVGKELMSYEVKELAAVDTNFQGTLTGLQMQTYLILSDFHQRKNKKGQTYGWHIAAVETPKTKWGREFVTSAYTEDPMESWNKINNPSWKQSRNWKSMAWRHTKRGGYTVLRWNRERISQGLNLPSVFSMSSCDPDWTAFRRSKMWSVRIHFNSCALVVWVKRPETNCLINWRGQA